MFTTQNPRCAESGEGCGAVKIKCRLGSIIALLRCAGAPQSKKTRPCFFSFKVWDNFYQ